MKVYQLISRLKEMPQDADVWHIWDGDARTEVECVWVGRNGRVMTADIDESVYSLEDRPKDLAGWQRSHLRSGLNWSTSRIPDVCDGPTMADLRIM